MERARSIADKMLQKSREWTLRKIEQLRKEEEERLETGVIHLPTCREDKRIIPNSFLRSALFAAIQSKDRKYLEKAQIFSQEGITVTYTGKQLNQEDMTVWLALVDLMKKDPLATECKFTPHEILNYMDLEIGGSGYERLENSIGRMIACMVVINMSTQTYMGNLIQGCLIDERTKVYQLSLNRHLIKLFGDSDWTALDWAHRKQLKNKPLCLKLHEYYSSHGKPLPVSLEFLSNISGSTNSQKASFKRQVKTALEELVKIGFFGSYSIEGNIVKVERVK